MGKAAKESTTKVHRMRHPHAHRVSRIARGARATDTIAALARLILHSTLRLCQRGGDFVLKLESLLLKSFEHFIRCWLFFRLDPMNLAIDLIIASGKPFELVVGLPQSLDQLGLVGKLLLELVRDLNHRMSSTFSIRVRAIAIIDSVVSAMSISLAANWHYSAQPA